MRLYSSSSSCSTRNSGERDNACLYSNYTPCCINFSLFLFLFPYNKYMRKCVCMRNNRWIGESIICGRKQRLRPKYFPKKGENIPRQKLNFIFHPMLREQRSRTLIPFLYLCDTAIVSYYDY